MGGFGAYWYHVGKLWASIDDAQKWFAVAASTVAGAVFPVPAMQTAAIGVMLIIGLDTLTGIRAARRRGEAISSAKIGRLIDKLIAYFALCALIAIVTRCVPGLGVAQGPTMTFAMSAIILRESVSVAENIVALGVSVFGIDKWLKGLLGGLAKPALPGQDGQEGKG